MIFFFADILEDLTRKDVRLYTDNGLINMLNRNVKVKTAPGMQYTHTLSLSLSLSLSRARARSLSLSLSHTLSLV
jgi:hypothetical protein